MVGAGVGDGEIRMKRALGVALFWLSMGVHAQQWLPSHDAVHVAIDAQPSVVAARARLDAAKAQARALTIGAHEFQLEVGAQRRTTDELGGRQRFSESEVMLSRAFRLPGKARLDRTIGDASMDSAELRLDDARHQAARLLLDDWMTWLRAAEAVRRTTVQLDSFEREQRALLRRVTLGDAARKDLDLLAVEQAQARAAKLSAQAALETAKLAMHSDFPSLPIPERVPDVDAPVVLPGTAEVWITRIIDRSHEIGALEADARGADARADRARADRIADPTLGLRKMSERGGEEQIVGLVFSMPLGGGQRRALASAEAANAAALHGDAAAMRRDISHEAVVTVTQATRLAAQWQAQREALAASAAALQRVKRGWELGEIGMSEWLQVQRQHHQIAATEADARADAEAARLRVQIDAHDIWHDD